MTVKEIKPGAKFNKLTVIKFSHYIDGGVAMFKCKCDCGNIVTVRGVSLTSNHTKSCGRCLEREMIGKRFGSLTVISVSHRDISKQNRLYFKCKCDCGGEIIVSALNLRQSKTKSCGHCIDNSCLNKKFNHLTILENIKTHEKTKYVKVRCDCGNERNMIRHGVIHGRFKTCGKCYRVLRDSYRPEIKKRCTYLAGLYDAIWDRCSNPNNIIYYAYGGRGIKCDFTREEFVKEYYLNMNIDIYNLQVDRIDNNKNYSFDNIRWVSGTNNMNNRLYNYDLTYDDIAKRLLSVVSFRRFLIANNALSVENEYDRVKFPLFTKAGESLFLFIHKSLRANKEFYINRIVQFYKNDGRDLEMNKIFQVDTVDKAVDDMVKYYHRNQLLYDKTLRTFYDNFLNMKTLRPEYDNIDVVDIFDLFIRKICKSEEE